ncbi:methyltransferase [Nocardioides luteus]|uniref:methyltransferase n=1 Tax=Nocardioides luteus TaxID=1844 RepID=UPI001A262706|nr:class I SAM-dependent methyltransferase [Nocardioides luteus]MBG6095430.1 release factor glutamine methyltransferase [Nocardioides luteus]
MIRFGHLDIDFDERVLTPRTWTARQSEWAAELSADLPDGPMLELCSGAGQIGLLAAALVGRRLVCVDADPVACEFARANAERAGLSHLVEVRHSSMDQALDPDERFHLVIADPPWVPTAQVGRYPEDPLLAIDGGADGMQVARTCLAATARHLSPGGAAVLQLGTTDQADRVLQLLEGSDLAVEEVRDSPGEGVLVHIARAAVPSMSSTAAGYPELEGKVG